MLLIFLIAKQKITKIVHVWSTQKTIKKSCTSSTVFKIIFTYSILKQQTTVLRIRGTRSESIELFIEDQALSPLYDLVIWLHPQSLPVLPSASYLSFSVFLYVASWVYWRDRGGVNSYDSENAWSSINHTILYDPDPDLRLKVLGPEHCSRIHWSLTGIKASLRWGQRGGMTHPPPLFYSTLSWL